MDNPPPKNFEFSEQRRPRRLEDARNAEMAFPLVWIVIGGLAGLIVTGLIGLGVVNLLRQGAITPTPQVFPPLLETIEPTPLVENTPAVVESPTETAISSPTPELPSPDATEPLPDGPALPITVNGYVRVINTDGLGVSMRGGPGRNNARIGVAEESREVTLQVVDGPRDDENGEDFVWWYIRHPDGIEGWVVEDFLLGIEGP